MRRLRALVYGVSGILCFVSVFFTKAPTTLPNLLLPLIGIGLSVSGLRQLNSDERYRLGGLASRTLFIVCLVAIALYCTGETIVSTWLLKDL